MNNRTILFTISYILIFAAILVGQTSKVGTSGAQFLKIGVGARAVAMGEAGVSCANDASAIFWNPAGLTQTSQREAMFLHAQWLAGLRFDFAGLIVPINERIGTLSFFTTVLSTPEDVVRTVYHPQGTGEMFHSIDFALGFGYARKLTSNLSMGVNTKYIRQSIWKMSGSSWALDFGAVYRTNVKNFRAGIAISNFGAPIHFGGQAASLWIDSDPNFVGNELSKAELETNAWELPLAFRFGCAFDLLSLRNVRLTLAADLNNPNDNNEFANFGCEYGIKEMVFIRAGYRGLGIDEAEGGLAAGGGFTFKIGTSTMRLNYAFVDYGRLQATHRYDLSIAF